MTTSPRTYAALLLLSFAALMSQVALTRFFSFSIWYHFAYMTISVALLGYGAAGSFYYAFPGITARGVERALFQWSLASGLLFLLALVTVSWVPFDPSALFPSGTFDWRADPRQFLYLSLFYLAVTAPFFAAGVCITILFRNAPGNIPQLYFADLFGAAVGCILAVVLLTPFGAPGVVLLGAVCLAGAAALFAWQEPGLRRAAVAGLLVLAAVAIPVARYVDVVPSSSKFLTAMLKGPNTEVVFRMWNPVYRVDVLQGKNSPIRFGRSTAWGVSDTFEGQTPENLVITHDGDASTMMYRFAGDFDELAILDYSLLKLPYLLLQRPEVLVIGAGGGVDLLTALKNGANHVTGVELNSVTVGVLKRDFADYNGGVFNRPDVTLVVDEGRNYVRRGHKEYDLIQITGIDTLAAIYSGAYVLSESYLYTVEAMREYLSHLSPNGMLSVVRGDARFHDQPPRQVLRLLSVAIAALREMGVTDPARHIALTMSKGRQANVPIFSILVRRSPFTPEDVAALEQQAKRMGFEPQHLPGQALDTQGGQFIRLGDAERERFLADHWLNLYPPTDDQPFFFNFLKWTRLIESTRMRSDYTFASGQLVLIAILVQSIVFAVLLIIAPLLRVRSGGTTPWRWRYLFYFGSLGMGFIFIEISYIQRFSLFLGSPVFSLSVILATLLSSLGAGSLLSAHLSFLEDTPAALRRLLVALTVVNLLYIFLLPAVLGAALGTGLPFRIAVTVALLAPAGVVMGAFLPVGMRVLAAQAPEMIPWAWAANGVTSVVGSIACIVLAISIGFQAVNIAALLIYFAGVLALLGPASRLARAA